MKQYLNEENIIDRTIISVYKCFIYVLSKYYYIVYCVNITMLCITLIFLYIYIVDCVNMYMFRTGNELFMAILERMSRERVERYTKMLVTCGLREV